MIMRGDYNYFIHPITDGVPQVDAALLRDVGSAMIKALDLDGATMIVVAEAMGIHLGTTLSLMTDIPFTVVRKRKYDLPGEIAIHQTTGYSKGELYLNGIGPGDRVVIVDDVISTGGTMRALIQAIEKTGAELQDVCVVFQRGSTDIGRPFKVLLKIEVEKERVRVIDRYF